MVNQENIKRWIEISFQLNVTNGQFAVGVGHGGVQQSAAACILSAIVCNQTSKKLPLSLKKFSMINDE